MKIFLEEYNDQFAIDLRAETMEEANLIGRIAFLRTRKIDTQVWFFKDSAPELQMRIGKNNRANPGR